MTLWPPRNVLAGTLAPAAPVLLFFVLFVVLAAWDGSRLASDTASFLGWVALVSYAGFVLLGLPTVLVLRRVGSLKLWTLFLSGAVLGTITLSVFQLLLFWPYSSLSPEMIGNIALWGAPAGVSVAIAYWLIGLMRHNNTVETDRPQAARRSL